MSYLLLLAVFWPCAALTVSSGFNLRRSNGSTPKCQVVEVDDSKWELMQWDELPDNYRSGDDQVSYEDRALTRQHKGLHLKKFTKNDDGVYSMILYNAKYKYTKSVEVFVAATPPFITTANCMIKGSGAPWLLFDSDNPDTVWEADFRVYLKQKSAEL